MSSRMGAATEVSRKLNPWKLNPLPLGGHLGGAGTKSTAARINKRAIRFCVKLVLVATREREKERVAVRRRQTPPH